MSPMMTWEAGKNCQGYNIRWGIAPDKLYNSWLVYGKNELLLKSLTTDQSYYFTIEAFNENGISEPARLVEAKELKPRLWCDTAPQSRKFLVFLIRQ